MEANVSISRIIGSIFLVYFVDEFTFQSRETSEIVHTKKQHNDSTCIQKIQLEFSRLPLVLLRVAEFCYVQRRCMRHVDDERVRKDDKLKPSGCHLNRMGHLVPSETNEPRVEQWRFLGADDDVRLEIFFPRYLS